MNRAGFFEHKNRSISQFPGFFLFSIDMFHTPFAKNRRVWATTKHNSINMIFILILVLILALLILADLFTLAAIIFLTFYLHQILIYKFFYFILHLLTIKIWFHDYCKTGCRVFSYSQSVIPKIIKPHFTKGFKMLCTLFWKGD